MTGSTQTLSEPTTNTLEVPGAVLAYDVRRNEASTEPALLLIGSPMGAAGFGTLSRYFADRTVVTCDPRGVERSLRTDPAPESTPDQHADDLHRLIRALGAGPLDLFASNHAGFLGGEYGQVGDPGAFAATLREVLAN